MQPQPQPPPPQWLGLATLLIILAGRNASSQPQRDAEGWLQLLAGSAGDGSDSSASQQQRQRLNLAQRRLVAPLTKGRGFSEPMRMDPSAYRALLSEFEARWPEHTSHEAAAEGYLSGPAPQITRLRHEALAAVSRALLPVVTRWAAGVGPLTLTAIYGVRTYTRGAMLEPHVDRLSHALSVIVNVQQEGLAEPWALAIEPSSSASEGEPPGATATAAAHPRSVDVTLQPGEMLLYESARLMHGRPQPLNGSGYSNLFVHYRPVAGWDYEPQQLELAPLFAETLAKQPLFDIGGGLA
jgi:hypothetical protein